MDVRLPDGTIVKNVPDDMPKAQFQAWAEGKGHSFGAATAPKKAALPPLTADPREGMPWYEKMAVGAGEDVASSGRGLAKLAQMAGLGGEKLESYIQKGDEDAAVYDKYHPGGWATTGKVLSNIAQTVIPVAKGAQAVTKGAKYVLPRAAAGAAPLIGDIAANAGVSAALAPEKRGTAAVLGGASAGAGHVLSKTLGGPVAPSIEGQMAIDAGARLTPGQAGEGMLGSAVNAYERHLSNIPVLGASVRNARKQGVDDLMQSGTHQFDPEDVMQMHRELRRPPTTPNSLMHSAIAAGHSKATWPLSVATVLGTTELGSKLMLGQVPWQRFAREDPVMAGKVARMLSKTIQPSGAALEGSAAAQGIYDQAKGGQNAP